ncbi:MAG: putative sugar nucleotidyltransferase [Gammaproteobacteria bacterium]|nr:putative sugar nucleotidyltransferase [Gammaproteobacteria bacterium]
MKLVILAAGIGSRLFPLAKDTPKSLLDLGNGVTLLERQLEIAMSSPQIKQVVIVTGYKHNKMEEFLANYQGKTKNIQLEYNPFFDKANNLITLWTIRHLLQEEDFIISNGDNLYKNYLLQQVIKQTGDEEGIFVTIDHKDHYDDDDMKVTLNPQKNITRVHKLIPTSEAQAESVGLVLVKGKDNRLAFINAILKLVKSEKGLDFFWLEILNQLVLDNYTVKPVTVEHSDWREMDFHPDVNTIRESLLKNLF